MRRSVFLLAALSLTACGGEPAASTSSALVQDEVQLPALPVLVNAKVVVKGGEGLATVQPHTVLNFKYESCGERQWTVATRPLKTVYRTVTYVQVTDALGGIDCPGPTKLRDYSVQVSSDATVDGDYIIINPTQYKNKAGK